MLSSSCAYIRCIKYLFYLRCSIKGAFSHSSLSILPFSVKKRIKQGHKKTCSDRVRSQATQRKLNRVFDLSIETGKVWRVVKYVDSINLRVFCLIVCRL